MHTFRDRQIDDEHDRIISEFDALSRTVAPEHYGSARHRELLDRLLHYTSAHFRREEDLMRRAGYPGLGEHVMAHAFMQRDFRETLRHLALGSPNLRADLELMRQMFLRHIVTYDEAFGAWRDPTPSPATSGSPRRGRART